MAISFPTGLDNFTNPSSGNTLDSPSHSLQHSDLNDAVEALERKVGLGTAVAGSASAGQVLTISAAGTSTWVGQGLTQIIPTSVAVGSGSGSVDANGAVTFSGASSVSLNDCFTSTYDKYRIVISVDSCTTVVDTDLSIRLRTTSDDSGTNYRNRNISISSTGTTANYAAGNGQNDIYGFAINTTNKTTYGVLDMFNPNLATYTGIVGQSIGYNLGVVMSNMVTTTTQYTGFSCLIGSGTATGSVRVYGYKN